MSFSLREPNAEATPDTQSPQSTGGTFRLRAPQRPGVVTAPAPTQAPAPAAPRGIVINEPEAGAVKDWREFVVEAGGGQRIGDAPAPDTSWANIISTEAQNLPRRFENAYLGVKASLLGDVHNPDGINKWLNPFKGYQAEARNFTRALRKDPDNPGLRAYAEAIGADPELLLNGDWRAQLEQSDKVVQGFRATGMANDERLQNALAVAQENTDSIRENTVDLPTWSAKGLSRDIAIGAAEMGPAILAGLLTRNMGIGAQTGAGIMGAQAFGHSYLEALQDMELPHELSKERAYIFALAEFAGEAIPLRTILSDTTKLKKIFKAAYEEGIQEGVTEVLQQGYDFLRLDEDITFSEFLEGVAHSMVVGAGVGGTLAAITPGGGAEGERKAEERTAKFKLREPRKEEPPKSKESAPQEPDERVEPELGDGVAIDPETGEVTGGRYTDDGYADIARDLMDDPDGPTDVGDQYEQYAESETSGTTEAPSEGVQSQETEQVQNQIQPADSQSQNAKQSLDTEYVDVERDDLPGGFKAVNSDSDTRFTVETEGRPKNFSQLSAIARKNGGKYSRARGKRPSFVFVKDDDREKFLDAVKDLEQARVDREAAAEKQPDLIAEQDTPEWQQFESNSGTLGIPRAEMPQVKAEHRGALVNFLKGRGITSNLETVQANSLKPTQAEFSPEKVQKAIDFEGGNRSILVSSDNYVVDGHHQWLASVDQGIQIIRIDAPIKDLLAVVTEFPSVETSGGATSVALEKAVGQEASAQAGIEEPQTPEPAKWFGSNEKAKAWIEKQVNPAAYEIKPNGKRFEIFETSKEPTKATKQAGEVDVETSSEKTSVAVKPQDDGVGARKLQEAADSTRSQKGLAVASSVSDKIRSAKRRLGEAKTPEAKAKVERDIRELRQQASKDSLANDKRPSGLAEAEYNEMLEKHGQSYANGYEANKQGRAIPYTRGEQTSTEEFTRGWIAAKRGANTAELAGGPQKQAQPKVSKKAKPKTDTSSEYGTANKTFTADAAEEARRILKEKLNNLNTGIDPETLRAGITLAGYHIEAGARSFAVYSKAMVDDLGVGIKPFLRSFYESVRHYPGFDNSDMDTSADIDAQMSDIESKAPEDMGVFVADKPTSKSRAKESKAKYLTQDWGVDDINGYNDEGLDSGNPIKTAFLKEVRSYLTQVSGHLLAAGFGPISSKGKAVSVNESGVAGSGSVTLALHNPVLGAYAYVSIEATTLRGIVPTTEQGVSVMYRVSTKEGENFAINGTNRWAPVDLSSSELADIIAQTAERESEAIARTNNRADNTREAQEDAPQNDLFGEGTETANVIHDNDQRNTERDQPASTSEDGEVGGVEQSPGRVPETSGVSSKRSGTRSPATGRKSKRADVSGDGKNAPSSSGSARNRAKPDSRGIELALRSNYQITDRDSLGVGGSIAKARGNLDAIRILKTLNSEGREPTQSELKALVKYVGWGASDLANKLFPSKGEPQGTWKELRDDLKGLLSEQEYETAARSTQYAHYTSKSVIDAIWSAVSRMGMRNGMVFEGGMGTGNFIGLAPSEMNLHYSGVEMDVITAGIAKVLYPESGVINGDFTKLGLPENYYDLTIGNPPFASVTVLSDPKYRRHKFKLHDYFIAKQLDALKPGGVAVFVTSKGTMDKANQDARKYVSDRVDLLGAIRLPQTAFKENAGTEVVTDILFFKKRKEGEEPAGKAWLETREVTTPEGPTNINEYFSDNPQMILGKSSLQGSMYGPAEYTVLPTGDIQEQLAEAVARLPANVVAEQPSPAEIAAKTKEFELNPSKTEGSYYFDDSKTLRQVTGGVGEVVPVRGAEQRTGLSKVALKVVQSYVPLRDAVLEVYAAQSDTARLAKAQAVLHERYDEFVTAHGPINRVKTTIRKDGLELTREPVLDVVYMDPYAYQVAMIERYDEASGEATKHEIFYEPVRTQNTTRSIESAVDALSVTLNDKGYVDLDYLAELYGTTPEAAFAELDTAVYVDPATQKYVTEDEYLSGNVKAKLAIAKERAQEDRSYERNVKALEAIQPEDLPISRIPLNLGAMWIPSDIVQRFAIDVLQLDGKITSFISGETSNWQVTGRAGDQAYATGRRKAHEILSAALNRSTVKVYDTVYVDGNTKQELNKNETAAANQKVEELRNKFQAWVLSDNTAADLAHEQYNARFNTTVPRKFNGAHLALPGLSSRYTPHDWQRNAVWRTVVSGNTYYAHTVGSGKTLTSTIAAMELKRLGLAKKPAFSVLKSTLKQFAMEFLDAYPNAKVLIADERQLDRKNLKRFYARLTAEDWDAVVLSHQAFEKIALSNDFTASVVESELDDYRKLLDSVDEDDRAARKQIERQVESMEQRLEAMSSSERKIVGIPFEETGIDFLFVDEAHHHKKIPFPTNQSNLKGVDPNGSNIAYDMYLKSKYLNQVRPGRAIVLMSGTPVTNTVGEVYNIQRYLQPHALESGQISSFDTWSSTFTTTVTDLEMQASGTFKPSTRLAKFVGVPALMRDFLQIADVVTDDDLKKSLTIKRPAIRGGQRQIVTVPRSPELEQYQAGLAKRIAELDKKKGPPKKGDDNILVVIGDAKKASIDMRLVGLPQNTPSKLDFLIDDVFKSWEETKDKQYKSGGKVEPEKGATQLIFTEIRKAAGFDIYDYIKDTLVSRGVPAEQIAYIQDYGTTKKKKKLFRDMNTGVKRILLGGSKNLGTGTNVQQRLYDINHLDIDYLPANIVQREGRGVRQGNKNPDVGLRAYATSGTVDAFMWQLNETKQRMIDQVMSGNLSIDEVEDISDNASQMAQAKALASGNPLLLEQAGLSAEVTKLRALRDAHINQTHNNRRAVKALYYKISILREAEKEAKALSPKYKNTAGDEFAITVFGKKFVDRKKAGDFIQASMNSQRSGPAGSIAGFELLYERNKLLDRGEFSFVGLESTGDNYYKAGLGDPSVGINFGAENDSVGIIKRLENAARRVSTLAEEVDNKIQLANRERVMAEEQINTVFQYGDDLAAKQARLDAIDTELAGTAEREEDTVDGSIEEEEVKKSARAPSLDNEQARQDDLTAADIDTALRKSPLGAAIGAAIDSGRIILHNSHADMPGGEITSQALTMPDGTIHLAANQLSEASVLPVLMHEAFHSGAEAFLGTKAWAALKARLEAMYKHGHRSKGAMREFWQAAQDRIERAESVGDKMSAARKTEEYGAYVIEEYESAPPRLRKWFDDLVGAIKKWVLKFFGKQVGRVTPGQMASIAKSAIRTVEPSQGRAASVQSISANTKTEYEQRIEDLFADGKPNREGVKILDSSDVLVMLGFEDLPMHVAEGKIKSGQFTHRLTAEHWKKVPQWLENPVAVFDAQNHPGRLVFFAPETLKDGSPISIIIETETDHGRADVHLAINAYERTRGTPVHRWAEEGLLRYLNQKGSPAFNTTTGLRLPRVVHQMRGSQSKVYTERDLVKSRLSRGIKASVKTIEGDSFKRWFGDSKVIDAGGKPLIVYHGSESVGIESFNHDDPKFMRFYFTNSKEVADQYGKGGKSRETYAVYLKMENPHVLEMDGTSWFDDENGLGVYLQLQQAKDDGHDGVILRNFADNANESDRTTSDVYVVFDNRQIKSATGNDGSFDANNPDIRYSIDTKKSADDVSAAIKNSRTPTMLDKMGWKLQDYRANGLYFLGRNQLVEIGSKVMPTMNQYLAQAKRMDAFRNNRLSEKSVPADAWREYAKKNRREAQELADLMHDTTIEGVDPSVGYTPITDAKTVRNNIKVLKQKARDRSGENTSKWMHQIKQEKDKLNQEKNRAAASASLYARWNRLSPEAKDIYVTVRDSYSEHQASVLQALIQRIEENIASTKHRKALIDALRMQFENQRVQAPYFPLSRFGEYWVRVNEVSSSEYSFHMFEGKGAQEAFMRSYENDPTVTVTHGKKLEAHKEMARISPGFVADVQTLLEQAGNGPTITQIKDEIYQMYLTSLPDLSVRKHFIHRGKISGYSQDAIRSFSNFMFHGAYQLARLRYSHRLENLLEEMRSDVGAAGNQEAIDKITQEAIMGVPGMAQRVHNITAIETDPDAATDFLNELQKRHDWAMNPKGSKTAQFLTSFGFIFFLGVSPAAAMVNLTQTPMVAYPVMGAKWGFDKSAKELSKAMADFYKGKQSGGSFSVNNVLKGEERAAFAALEASGILDKTLGHDLAGMSEQGFEYNSAAHKVMNVASYFFHHAERFNREVTALASYRLARNAGQSHLAAVQSAGDVTETSHFDYSSSNKARLLHSDTARVLLLFRQFALNMTYLLARSTHQAFKGASQSVKTEARRRLAGILGMTAIFAGLQGLPLFWVVKFVLETLFDDEDDPWVFEAEFRQGLVELTGSKTAGAVIARGPMDVLTGASISSRVGLDDLWIRDNNRELEGQAAFQYWLEQVAGPIGGAVGGAFRWGQLMDEGRYGRAFEALLPVFARNSLKAWRFNQEGANSMRGDALIEEMPSADLVRQVLGFVPTALSERYEENSAIKNVEQRILSRRSRLLDRYALAFRLGDVGELEDISQDIGKFNTANPTVGITNASIRQSLRSRQNYSNRATKGIILNPNLMFLGEKYDFVE